MLKSLMMVIVIHLLNAATQHMHSRRDVMLFHVCCFFYIYKLQFNHINDLSVKPTPGYHNSFEIALNHLQHAALTVYRTCWRCFCCGFHPHLSA